MKKVLPILLVFALFMVLALNVQSQDPTRGDLQGVEVEGNIQNPDLGNDVNDVTENDTAINNDGFVDFEGALLASRATGRLFSVAAGLYQSPRDGRYYSSSRWKLWIYAVEPDEETAIGIRKIEVALDGGDYYEYGGSQLLPFETEVNDITYNGVRTGDFSVQKEGPHTIVFRSFDDVGNQESNNYVNFWIDNTPPIIEAQFDVDNPRYKVFIQGGITYLPAAHVIKLYAFDTGCGVRQVQYLVRSPGSTLAEEWMEYAFTAEDADRPALEKLPSGWNILHVRAVDHVGNLSDEQVYNIFVDDVAPIVEIQPGYPLILKGETQYAGVVNDYSVIAVDRESGLAATMIRVDDRGWDLYIRPVEFSTSGPHKIDASAMDNVGNIGSLETTFNVVVDVVPPVSAFGGNNPFDFLAEEEEAPADDAPADEPVEETP